jgi:hypothetical protein
MIRKLLVAALAICAGSAATAHSFWLEPTVHTVDPGERVAVAFRVGDGADVSDWALYWERVAALRLYGPEGVIDQLGAIRATGPGERGGAVFLAPAPGSYVLGFESNPSFSDLGAAAFNDYVDHEGLTAIAAHRLATGATQANGTENYARRAKALIQVGAPRTANVTRPIGQTLEIVPLANPLGMKAGDMLEVQLLWRGAPLPGARIAVVRPAADHATEVIVTDTAGKARFALKHGSRYLLSSVWGVPAPNDNRAAYQTIFASLTFPSPD